VPHPGDEIVLADDAVAVAQQVDQQVEHLRLDRNELRPAAQLAPLDIERVVAELEVHPSSPVAAASGRIITAVSTTNQGALHRFMPARDTNRHIARPECVRRTGRA
jgi:hypothetical protein